MDFGDTNFIGVANTNKYESFVDGDWELDNLLQHFGDEMKQGHILVFQMTEEGIEHSWRVEVRKGTEKITHKYFRKAVGHIQVTENQLYLVDYDCLTMAAQFQNHKVPDQNCSKYKIEIENGFYEVEVVQYYNVDEDEYVGASETDILLNFIKVSANEPIAEMVFWCTY
ncbi:hypothetical protein [Bacillus toyonensis]|uniref:hypothetical protein n=1 Tax=Bacillus toyonensis TaxID=155322 RepID=UPI000BED1DFD|nr:hypothetical protein [Bacillus toyonensis]PEF97125.1 hypothetical protein COO01_20390 [Bacillus toyonensis]